jgi:hypothetical protein
MEVNRRPQLKLEVPEQSLIYESLSMSLGVLYYVSLSMCLGVVSRFGNIQCSVSNRSGYPASGPGLDRKISLVRFQTRRKTQTRAFCQAKPVSVPINPRVLPGLARPVGSSLQFTNLGFSIYGCSQICYCDVQNINFGTSFSLFVSLAAIILKTT